MTRPYVSACPVSASTFPMCCFLPIVQFYDGDYYVYNMFNNIADVSSYKTASSFVKKENYIYGFLLN